MVSLVRMQRLENQDGAALAISAEDQSLLMTGMWLHESAKCHMQQVPHLKSYALNPGDRHVAACKCKFATCSRCPTL